MKTTMFKPFSIGVVAENKPILNADGSICKVISVTPSEDLPFLDGEVKENVTATEYSGTNDAGEHYEGTLTTDNTMNATWLPFGANRVTPPDVRRGMRVLLYRMGDDDGKSKNVYWHYTGMDDHLMKLETVIIAFSASPDNNKDVIDVESCYFIEISSHKKNIMLHTSTANGEPFEYLFQFNTGEGTVDLKDDIDNGFYLNSNENQVGLRTADGAFVEVNKKDINGYAPKNVNISADQNINIKAGKDIIGQAGGKIQLSTGATTFTLNPDGTILATPSFKGVRT